ncbi:Helicase associated domain protein [Streptomyces sp. NPDC047082]|uniref:helicase associated domain-containing protein n=1 Tax=Streptomyces sp. NPDC047082 TaxID=3155259 RepID=UPI0033FDF024
MRADRLARFGARAGRAVLASCRVLNEGVDVPTVDSVALIDPKGSAVDIVQAIGRALRQTPGQNKLATLIVPIFLGPDETEEDMPYSVSYRPLIKVLSGLRAHDERAVEMLAVPQEGLHRAPAQSSYQGEAPGEGEDDQRVLLRFGTHRDPALIARLVRYNLLKPEHENWKAGHRAAVAYRRRTGHLAVPYEHRELMPNGHSHPLGRWLADQRRALAAGGLATQRANDLDELGMVWDPTDAAWEENLAAARAYYAETGTLAAPVTATALDRPVGQWLANCRKTAGLGKDTAIAARRERQLAAIDEDWRPSWPVDWQRNYASIARLLAAGAELDEIVPGVTAGGTDVGGWLHRQLPAHRVARPRRGAARTADQPGHHTPAPTAGTREGLPGQRRGVRAGLRSPGAVPGPHRHCRARQPLPGRNDHHRRRGTPSETGGVPVQHQNPSCQARRHAASAARRPRPRLGGPGRGGGVRSCHILFCAG